MFKTFSIILVTIILSINAYAETKITIATGELPPFVSRDFDKSFLTEVFQEIEKDMNVVFIFKFMPWKRCEIELQKGTVWAAIPYVRTEERDKLYFFSERLFARHTYFFYYSPEGKKNIPYSELNDLKKFRIGGVMGYYYEKIFQDAGIDLELVTSEEQDFYKLQLGRIDLTPSEEITGWFLIKSLFPEDEIKKFHTLPRIFHSSDIYLMSSRNYPDSKNILYKFNSSLIKIKNNGSFQKIMDRRALKITP